MKILSLENINSGYGKKEVIKNISFTINEAEIVTLIGSNGAGKSTVLKTIYGLNSIWNDGTIKFNEENISNCNPENLLKKGIVYIGQKNNTFENLTVLENLKTAGYIYPKKLLEQKILTLFKEFPFLETIKHKKIIQLSGGQRQLVALSMGLIHEPKFILFDEPSAGLDIKNMKEIFAIIKKFKIQKNISFLIVEHRITEIANITDRWIGLKLGRKIYDGHLENKQYFQKIFL